MPRLRVLHVIGGLELGGAETLLCRLVTHQSPDFTHEVICLGERGWYSSRLEELGITVHHLGMASALSTLRGLGRLGTLLRDRRPDVIHSWMYLANVLSGALARRTTVPVVWSIHASTFAHLGVPSRICAYIGGLGVRQLSSFVINCSERSAQRHARFGYGASSSTVIHNGYDPSAFLPNKKKRTATRAGLGLEPNSFVIGSVSRWHSEKDVPTLLAALAILRSRGLDFRCLLVGPGLDLSNPRFAHETAALGLDECVVALGRRDDVANLYRALDLHILSSRSEAFPNVIGESMLSGVPNVVTDVGNSALMVAETGWVVPPRDPDAMADAVARAYREWANDRPAWEQRLIEARRRIVERFTFDRMVAAYEGVWRRVAAA